MAGCCSTPSLPPVIAPHMPLASWVSHMDAYDSILPLLQQMHAEEWRSAQTVSGAEPCIWQGCQWEKYATDKRPL